MLGHVLYWKHDRLVTDFYDRLSSDYHLIFGDWKKSVIRQGEVLDKIIRTQIYSGIHPLL